MNFSVLMSIYCKDKSEYLETCLHSLVEQTLKANQVVLVEDGPISSQSKAIIERFRNTLNITSVTLCKNVGLAYALNEGLKYCSNELIMRMDADDIALPDRFQVQMNYMMMNPMIVASSGWLEEFNNQGYSFIRKIPESHEELKYFAKWRSPIAHPACIFRKSDILKVGGYPSLRKSQDYALWAKLLVNGYKIANLPVVLVRMRVENVFGHGRGCVQLRNEWRMLWFQKSIGFIGWYQFCINLLIRLVLRLSPRFIKIFAYKFFR